MTIKAFRMPTEWTCPFCGFPQIGTEANLSTKAFGLNVGESKHGHIGIRAMAARCLRSQCNETTLVVTLRSGAINTGGGFYSTDDVKSWRLCPESFSKPQPEYIPEPLRQNYYKACSIRDKSAKASATLARRCIQGMIRDFCGISKATLDGEIKELRRQFDAGTAHRNISDESIVAIDKVRKIGNIGAHMEKDINVIVDVDPDEAQLLIELVEMLFSEWYVAREKRRLRLEELSTLADEKQAARLAAPAGTPALPKP